MIDAKMQDDFLRAYATYVKEILEPTEMEAKGILSSWKRPGYWSKYTEKERLPEPSPIQRVRSRIKRPESVVDKIYRRTDDFPDGLSPQSIVKMQDCFGIRVIVYFLSQILFVDREIRTNPAFEVSTDHPPIVYLSEDLHRRLALNHIERKDKESGYASVHYMVRLRESQISKDKRPWFELQLRTMAEDLWGEIEHILGYKPGKRTSFAVRKQFRIISRELEGIDEHFNFLFEELLRFQEESSYNDTDPLNAENLPPVLSEIGIGCSQREIDGLLKLLFSRGMESVGQLRAVATNRILEMIRNTYRQQEGRHPINFEIVANLANLQDVDNEEEVIRRIRSQIEFLKVWEKVKRERSFSGPNENMT